MHGHSQYLFIIFLLNSIVHLRAQDYTAVVVSGQSMYAALGRSFELRCRYNGIGDGEFIDWFKKNATHDVSVNTDKPGHYVIESNEMESSLTIKIFGNRSERVSVI